MKIWTAVYHHRHGLNVYLFAHKEPTEAEVIARIAAGGEEFEPERDDEWVSIDGAESFCTDDVGQDFDGVFISSAKKRQYIHDQACPFCGESGTCIGEGRSNWDANFVTQPIRCENCEKEWEDHYELVDILPV